MVSNAAERSINPNPTAVSLSFEAAKSMIVAWNIVLSNITICLLRNSFLNAFANIVQVGHLLILVSVSIKAAFFSKVATSSSLETGWKTTPQRGGRGNAQCLY